jgi:hypothetical protein
MGSQTVSGTMRMELDARTTFLLAMPMPDTITGTHLAWNTGPITPFGYRTVSVLVELDTLLALNDTLSYNARIDGVAPDFDLSNQRDTAEVLVVTSFDPNDKTVSPAGSCAMSCVSKTQGTLRPTA